MSVHSTKEGLAIEEMARLLIAEEDLQQRKRLWHDHRMDIAVVEEDQDEE